MTFYSNITILDPTIVGSEVCFIASNLTGTGKKISTNMGLGFLELVTS